MMKRTPKTPALAKMAMLLLFAIAAVAILNTTSISAQELGRTITSPFGVANPYMNASDASESGSNGDTFVDPETGEVGHIIRNPFGVANPEGVDTGIDIPENAGEEVGGIITSPFGVPASDDIDTGVDVIDEDEEYLISLPKDEESDVEGAENVDEVDDETSDDVKENEEESAETTTEKVLPVIDNPTRGVEFTIELSLTGSTGAATEQYSVKSTTGNINDAPTLYVAPGASFTLTVASTNNQAVVKDNIRFYFNGTYLNSYPGVFVNPQYLPGSSSSSSHTFSYDVSPNVVYNEPHNVAVLYRYNNNVTIARYLKIEIKAFSILVDSNNDGDINSKDEATKRNGKLIHINNLDVDKDGIPDFADGYYRYGEQPPNSNNYKSESLPFTPIKIRISNCIDMQNLGIFFSFNEASINLVYNWYVMNDFDGNLRLWAKDGNEIRIVNSIADKWEPGDLICSGYDNIFPLNRLNGVPVGEYIEYTLYLEAVKPCNSFNGIPIQAQIVSNNWIVSSDYVVVTPYQIVFEGITSAKIENGIEKNALYNPCAIVKKIGKYAKIQFDTIPSNISCDAFNWSTSNNLRIVGENSGKKVTVRATDVADGEFTVTIDIGRDDDWNPSIKGTVFDDETRVKLFIWIVADDTVGNTPEFTVSEIDSIIKNVNYLYRQVGIRFVKAQIRYIEASQKINGIPVDYRNVANDDIGKILVQYPQNPQSPGYPRVEDGLEVFFVRTLKDGTTNGLSYEDKGIIVAKSSPDCSITLAHELGHACGLDDIYDDYLNGNFSSYESVNSLWMKRDCTYAKIPNYDNNGNNELKSATGYYTYNLSHVDLIHNLLMFGYAEVVLGEPYDRGDISLGMVYGIDYGGYRNYRKTGLEYEESGQVYYMNRTPTHKKTNSD